MKTITLQADDKPMNCRTGRKQPLAGNLERLHAISLTCALLVMTGGFCGQAAEATSKKDISGIYALVTVDGKKVPTTVSHEGHILHIRSGSFTIGADGSCASKMTFVPPSGVEATVEVKATSTREGRKLRMKWERAGMTTGTVEGDTFTMENEGMVFGYKK